MKKSLLLTIFFIVTGSNAVAQNEKLIAAYIDSLKNELAIAKDDTTRVLVLAQLAFQYAIPDFDACAAYSKQGLDLAQKIHFKRGEVSVLGALAGGLGVRGDIPKSMELLFRGLETAEENHYSFETALCLIQMSANYWFLNDFPQSVSYGKRAKQIYATVPVDKHLSYHLRNFINLYIGMSYNNMNQLDSAIIYLQDIYRDTSDHLYEAVVLSYLGDVQFKRGNHQKAFEYLYKSIKICEETNDHYTNADACKILASCFGQLGQVDSAIFYAKKGLADAQAIDYKLGLLENSKILALQYEAKDIKGSYSYLKMVIALNDELYGAKSVQDLQKTLTEVQERQRRSDAKRIAYENQLKQYGFFAGIAVLLLIAIILYRNNRQKQKANTLLALQKERVENTLQELKSTQAQLIQSEKMASLGELTAGIAHEIQNPLNFVNNFSEVNKELIEEMVEEVEKGNLAEVKVIANDIKENEEKINHHGKRADAIVKGMLQHSRSSNAVKEPTDINKLAEEYLRLAYHGLRAKDKSFNATLNTDLDKSIGNINVIPQDIGRAVLNLITNAFYAASLPSKGGFPDSDKIHDPTIWVSTKKVGDKILISVKDNGPGIPEKIVDKIFQPFFTTKPTGQGTGLGLSISYDIIKAHGGEIKVETKEREGTTFTIKMPLQ